jgi:glycosyltransferase involved in cell wall biosynthesis
MGGAELTHYNIASSLKDEFDFKFFSLNDGIAPFKGISKIGHEFVGLNKEKIKDSLIRNKIDLVFIQRNLEPVISVAKELGIPVIERIDGSISIKNDYDRNSKVDLIVCSSEGGRKRLNGWGIKTKTKLIYNGVDLSRIRNIKDNIPCVDFLQNEITVGISSRFTIHKRLEWMSRLIEAINKENVKGMVIGGACRFIKGRIKYLRDVKKSAHKNVFFAGKINSRSKYFSLVNRWSIATSFTDTWEGISNSLLEPMALGIPAVSIRVGDVDELIDNGKNGFVVNSFEEFVEKTKMLIEDKELRMKMGEEAKRTIEKKFNQRIMIEKYKQIFNEILNNKQNKIDATDN